MMPEKPCPLFKQDANNDISELLLELRSLGINAKRKNYLNDSKEINGLIDNIKQSLYREYKIAYSK
jgi:hypothetical protein